MGIQMLNGAVLINGGAVAIDPACCCGCDTPAPCSCPGGLNTSYCISFPAGTFVSGSDTFDWNAQALTVTGSNCSWSSSTPFVFTINGSPGIFGTILLNLQETMPCQWLIQLTLNGTPPIIVDIEWNSLYCDAPDGASPYLPVSPNTNPNAIVTPGAC